MRQNRRANSRQSEIIKNNLVSSQRTGYRADESSENGETVAQTLNEV